MRSAREGVFPAVVGERISSGGGRNLKERERRELVVEGPMEKKGTVVQEERQEEGDGAGRGEKEIKGELDSRSEGDLVCLL